MTNSVLSPLQRLLGPHADVVKRHAKIMRVRPLMFREFDPALRAVEDLDRCGRVLAKVTNKQSFATAKAITAASLYQYSAYFFEKNDHLTQIAHLNVRMNPHQLTFAARPFPVLADMAHVQLRHINRGGTVVDYGARGFVGLLGTALAMSEIISMQLNETGEEWMPIVIPEEGGLYLGYGQRIDPVVADPNAIIFAARRPNDRGGPALYSEKTPEWRPTTRIVISTYVSMDDASGMARQMYDLFAPFISHPAASEFAKDVVRTFTYGEHWAKDVWDPALDKKAAQDARGKLGNSLVHSAPPIRAERTTLNLSGVTVEGDVDEVSRNHAVFQLLTSLLSQDAWASYVRHTRPKIRPHALKAIHG